METRPRKVHLIFALVLLLFGNLLLNTEIKGTRAQEEPSYSFESGFENDILEEFDGTEVFGTNAALVRVTSPVYDGNYALMAQGGDGGWPRAIACKTFPGGQQAYVRVYVYFPELWTYQRSGREWFHIYFMTLAYGFPPAEGPRNQSIYWAGLRVMYYLASGDRPAGFYWTGYYYSSPDGGQKYFPDPDKTIPRVEPRRWYSVEVTMKRESSPGAADGEYRLWIDEEEIYTAPRYDALRHIRNNDNYSGPVIDTINLGMYETPPPDSGTEPPRVVILDSLKVSTYFVPKPVEIERWQMTFNHRDLDNNIVGSKVSWKLYNSTQLLEYHEGEYTLLNGTYTLKTYYHGILINSTLLPTSQYGNTTIDIPLQMKPHSSVSNGYIVFNDVITPITIDSQTDSNLTVTVSGSSPVTIIADVPRNATYVQRDDVNRTDWYYLSSIPSFILILNASVSCKWEFYFPPPQPINMWQMTWDWRDLDNNNVSPLVSWQLWNGSQQLTYTQGQRTLLDGTYTLKTFLQGEQISQVPLETTSYGNKTTIIKLQMKTHASVSGGYIAFDNIVTSIAIHSETPKNLTFTVSGTYQKIIIKVPQNASRIRKDGVEIKGWTFDVENKIIKISTSSLSTWTLIFAEEETTTTVWDSILPIILFVVVFAAAIFVIFSSRKEEIQRQHIKG